MVRRHKYAGASASITTQLDAARVAEISEEVARGVENIGVIVRLEESKPGRLVYSVRNRIVAGRIEYMTFEVTLREAASAYQVKTKILTYKMKRNWILVVPLPWQMLGWGIYKRFMYQFADGVTRADPGARASVVELAGVV